jgi:L-ribulose-5-phosphate 3-epimerase
VNTISFISANFVARELGYRMTEGWMQGDTATQNHFKPLETFATRFDAMLAEVSGMGFGAIDLWGAHLHPDWASPDHLEIANDALKRHGLIVTSLAAWCGSLDHVTGFCRVAQAVGAPVIAGGAPILQTARAETIQILKAHGVKLGLENHPEKTAQDLLDQIGDGANGAIGASTDTGWWATQGYDAPTALRELKDHLLTVHLKDVLAAGAHDTCRFGLGVANIEGCARTLRSLGYAGPIGIEHEPEDHNPRDDVFESKRLLEGWLQTA